MTITQIPLLTFAFGYFLGGLILFLILKIEWKEQFASICNSMDDFCKGIKEEVSTLKGSEGIALQLPHLTDEELDEVRTAMLIEYGVRLQSYPEVEEES